MNLARNYYKLMIIIVAIIASYYIAILLHEWGHGTVAWIFGYKEHFYDVNYGGWQLLHVDENVPYDQIIASGQGLKAALIGIAGLSVSMVLFFISMMVLKKIRKNWVWYTFFYWFATFNLVPTFQYLVVQTFSSQGDVGEFIHGLDISPWWIFIPGFIFTGILLFWFFKSAVPKAYAIISIKRLWVQRVFLLVTLGIIFLLIYTHGYNPLSDAGMPLGGKILAVFSMLLVPVLFFICNPSNRWVKKEIHKNNL